MKYLLLVPLLLMGCASTKICAPNGTTIANLQGDYSGLKFTYTGPGYSVRLESATALHSVATKAQGDAAHAVLGGVSTLSTSIGAAAATSGIVPLIAK